MINFEEIKKECEFKTARSSGAGGQHVNKVETKVVLLFNFNNSIVLNEDQKNILNQKLSNKINKDGFLVISSQASKSQNANKKDVLSKLESLLKNALRPKKKRKKTKPSKAAVEKRLKAKKIIAEKKKNRMKW